MDHNDKNLALVRVTLNGFGHIQLAINTLIRNSELIQVEGIRRAINTSMRNNGLTQVGGIRRDDAFANRGCSQRT